MSHSVTYFFHSVLSIVHPYCVWLQFIQLYRHELLISVLFCSHLSVLPNDGHLAFPTFLIIAYGIAV